MSKIAVLGAAPSSRKLAPFPDANWEIWACSPPNYDAPRVDAWFELHSVDRKAAMPANAPYIEVLKKHPRVYLSKPHQLIPQGVEYPLANVLNEFAPMTEYFSSSSLAWMMAFAIMQKPDMIGLWGVDMAANEEYGDQRPGCHFYIREALKRGIKVYVPPQSDLLQPGPLYGFKEHGRMFWKFQSREEELNQRLNATLDHMERLKKEELIFRGALDDISYIKRTWMDDGLRNWPELGVMQSIKEENGGKDAG